jgi:hypothetical protein
MCWEEGKQAGTFFEPFFYGITALHPIGWETAVSTVSSRHVINGK